MSRRVLLRRAAILIAIIATSGGNALAQRSQTCDAEAQAWVDENREPLPQTLEEYLAIPIRYRKAAYTRLAPETKSMLWRAHLSVFLDLHPALSREQKRALHDAIAFASPETFRIGVLADSRAARALDQRARALHRRFIDGFGANRARSLLSGLGVDDGPATDSDAGVEQIVCECADADPYCPGSFHCVPGGCVRAESGCGTLFLYDCDGLCLR